MPIEPGQSLKHYRLVEKIGEGGMGAVWKAVDTRLDREVAIKVLPESLSGDPARLARFEREAKAVAALSHPNILAIHDFGEQDGVVHAVMELLEGQSLRERLERGPLPQAKAVEIGIQIAQALAAAHGKEIVHRDIKPDNIWLTPDGRVKVLDFGLATFRAEQASSDSMTVTHATDPGTVMGTAAYMSPEQARAEGVDARSDIFSLGIVLYELLTGKHLFARPTAAETMTAVLQNDPPEMGDESRPVPPALERTVRHCLEKEPAERFQTARDLAFALGGTSEFSAVGMRAASTGSRRSSVLTYAMLGVLGIALVGLGFVLRGSGPAADGEQVSRWEVSLAEGQELLIRGRNHPLALSPDGRRLVYAAERGSVSQLHVRDTRQFDAVPLDGTDQARNPFFSPDGEWIGFFSEGELRKVPTNGGATLKICDAPLDNLGSAWGADGTIVFASYATGLWSVPAAGGEPQALTELKRDAGETQHRWPQFLPDGRLMMTVGTTQGSQVAIVSLADKAIEPVAGVEDVSVARYLPTGHLLLARGATLQVIPFDATSGTIRGAPVTMVEGVAAVSTQGISSFAVSDSGVLAYVPGAGKAGTRLVWVDHAGAIVPVDGRWSSHLQPRLSPNGRQAVMTVGQELGLRTIEVLDFERGSQRRLTFEASNGQPVWSPDGKRIAFASSRDGSWNLYWRAADGSGDAELLLADENELWPGAFSPTGDVLAYWEIDPDNARDIYVVPVDGDRTPVAVVATPFNERAPIFSPDGDWLAYISDETGRDEVYVRPYPGPGPQTNVSTQGGVEPLWSPDGRKLYYRNADRMMVVDVTTEPSFSVSRPRILFEGRFDRGVIGNLSYDIAPDGDRFLMIQPLGDRAGDSLRIVLNWFDEVQELASD